MRNQEHNNITIEVIMAAYNNTSYTRASLNGYTRQSINNFSIAISDDGSDDSIRMLAKEYEGILNIRHIWHEDKGYRRALILNKGIATSTADYIILVDNDCIPHKHFIKDHLTHARHKQCVTGRRVNLGRSITDKLIMNISHIKKIENTFSLLWLIARRKVQDGGRGIRLPILLSNLLNKKKRGLLGSNIAAWRCDLNVINGFDSSFTGYGYEETDLEWRLQSNGVHIQSLVNRAIQFHLYHKKKSPAATNLRRLNDKKMEDLIISPYGIREAKIELANTDNKS